MIVKRVGPLSFAKVSGFLYAVIGLIVGALFALVSILGGAVAGVDGGGIFGAFLGVGAVIALPICYGAIGFLMSLLMAALYNWAAGMMGGIELQVDDDARGSSPEHRG